MVKLSPSILSADFANLQRDIELATNAGAQYVHIDVMDGHFVPNITIGAGVVSAIRKFSDAVLDVHLMIQNPDQYLPDFIAANPDIITVHYESFGNTLGQIKRIKDAGIKAAIAIKPATPVQVLDEFLPLIDMALVMTVEPGFGGQSFMPEMLEKVVYLRKKIKENNYSCDIQVDGGLKSTNTSEVVKAGANIIVAGSAVFGDYTACHTKVMLEVMNDGYQACDWK
ncbi:MAG: ribulose-phosphate 3-epimerase [Clostridia bacterium]